MVSPYVRRLKLATELRALREEHGILTEDLAKRLYYSRTKISRLETAAGRPDVAVVMSILDILGVTGEEWERIIRLAHEAAVKGWWDRYRQSMGPRQRLYADLEFGA
ncbi:XRE family transcriptional regulator [Actinomadura spongiicola]|uniref:XRE family transcriptional regulator n=1 Tax=Actinomadura spongiicola TaxID=2303421 RepID=A0A372GIJ6_9ACTN|nr:helix-turn-helix transcriptional regulator [Actinomadura spongiicola]RFS85196.1 XRE family transcriptional regulator [Actinomadura spongiicola]